MNEVNRKQNELLMQKTLRALEKRRMTGYYAENREEALALAISLIPEGSTITSGGSMTLREIGLTEALKEGDWCFLDRSDFADPREAFLAAYDSDVYLASVNALTQDGILVNIDGNSNRVSAMAYGPRKVILIAGVNKLCADLDAAMKRARGVAAPRNAIRLNRQTPCVKTGSCMDCQSPDTICCQFLITRFSRHEDRIHVILVNEELGF
ncbi:MAG: lactate utilization protein [Lachnospiraceae bacterium]|nr:lactate utilization protein [Lachnospiraceae bacterium]